MSATVSVIKSHLYIGFASKRRFHAQVSWKVPICGLNRTDLNSNCSPARHSPVQARLVRRPEQSVFVGQGLSSDHTHPIGPGPVSLPISISTVCNHFSNRAQNNCRPCPEKAQKKHSPAKGSVFQRVLSVITRQREPRSRRRERPRRQTRPSWRGCGGWSSSPSGRRGRPH